MLDKWFWAAFLSLTFFTFLQEIYSLLGAAELMPTRRIKYGMYYLSFMFIPYFTFRYGRLLEGKFLLILAMIGFFGTALLTKRAAKLTGGIDLSRATVSFGDMSFDAEMDLIENRTFGVGSYEVVYQAAFVLGVCLVSFFFFRKKTKLAICLMMLIALGYSIKISGLGTPNFVAYVGLGLAGLWVITRSRKVIVATGISVCVGLWIFVFHPQFYSPLSPAFTSIAEALPEKSAMQLRFQTLSDTFAGDEKTYGFKRFRLQETSWNTFVKNPIFGIGALRKTGHLIGSHSLLFDAMGQFGLFGLISYFAFIFFIMKFFGAIVRLYGFQPRVIILPTLYYLIFIVASIANMFTGFYPIGYFVPFIWLFFDPRGIFDFSTASYWTARRRIPI